MESWWVMVAIGNIIYMIGAFSGSTPSTGRYTSVVIKLTRWLQNKMVIRL